MTRVAALQMTSTDDRDANLARAEQLLDEAAHDGASVAVLPENFAYMGRRDADKRALAEPEGDGPIQAMLARVAQKHAIWIVAGTIPVVAGGADGRVAAASLVFDASGRIVARYDKIHLFDVDVPGSTERYRESAHVAPGNAPVVIATPAGRLGLAVCYDVRFPELFRALVAAGAEWFCLPSAFTVPTGQAHWEPLLRARAIESLAYLVAPAQVGVHANGRATYGHSLIVDYWGRLLAAQAAGEGVIVADFDAAAQADARLRFPALRHRVL